VRTEGAEDAKSKRGVLRALVIAKVTPVGGELGALDFEQTAVAEREYALEQLGDPTVAWQAHVERAVSDVVSGVGSRVKLSTASPQALVAALDGQDGDLRQEGARLCAERKERACVMSLVKLLKSEDHDDRDRAIGALQSIGDARAVRPLTEVARFRDLSDLPKILDALAAIGGDEARSYLEFVASGHDSSEIRDLAKQALTSIRPAPAAPADKPTPIP
jgi:HEAT repeat protein